ncbi:MAG: DUF4974 domain-containing protein [Muribaculaceae bacterium]
MDKKMNEIVEFVARYYREGAFSARRGWRQLGLTTLQWWRTRWAAAAAVVVALTATAGIYAYITSSPSEARQPEAAPVTEKVTPIGEVSRKIEFADTPLVDVVKEIERVYEVRVVNLPKDGDYRLTLSYEGTAKDLVETINELLGISLRIEE